ncbi:hypothetical protein D3C75_1294380 [compost metagenome]
MGGMRADENEPYHPPTGRWHWDYSFQVSRGMRALGAAEMSEFTQAELVESITEN